MFSCFKNLLRPKTAIEQDKGSPKDRVEEQKVQPAFRPQSTASEGSRDNKQGQSAVKSETQSRDLWQEAFAKLDDDKRDLLSNIGESPGPSVVQNIADETKKRYRASHKEACKGKNHIKLRAAAEKILSSVLRSKKLIDAGVAFDPTGHSASAWTIISLGLQIVQNDIDRLQALLEASGILTDTLARCAAIEACYRDRDRNLPDSDHLEDTIVEVYVSILEFSAEMVSQNKMNLGRRVLKSINLLAEQPLQDFKTKLSAQEEDLQRWNQIIENQFHKQDMKQINQATASIFDEIDRVVQQLLSIEERTFLKWLSKYDYSASHRSAVSQRDPSTGMWIFDNPNYKKWKELDSRLLWLYGNSGSGKTVLCSKIVDDLQDLCAKDASYALAYWYFSDSNQSSLDLDNLLCSIIRQLCASTQTLPDKIRELLKVNHAAGGRPTRDRLREVLDELILGLTAVNQTAFIVLDALDEFPLSGEQTFSGARQITERKDALLWVRQFTGNHNNVRLMILSRDENDIRASLDEALQVDVARGVVDDLDLFISNCINRIVEEHSWKAQYSAAMSSRVGGISEKRFRWASLMQRKFSLCLDHEKMNQALENLPESLEGMYADVLTKQIPEEYREKARSMLMWLAYSIRPLRLRELAFVASLPDPMDVRRICTSSLITFSRETLRSSERSTGPTWKQQPKRESEEDTIVKFDHFSVKEYLMSEELLASSGGPVSYFFVPPLLAHLSIAQLSVSHVLDTNGSHFTEEDIYVTHLERYVYYDEAWEESWEKKQELATEFWPAFPLLEYSTFWHIHARKADTIEARLVRVDATKPNLSELKADTQSTLSQAEDSRSQIHKLFCKAFSQSFENWVLLLKLFTYEIKYNNSGVPSPMWLASLLNLPDNVRRLLQSEKEAGERRDFVCFSCRQPDFERTPIQIASKYGHLKVLKLLLETDMHVEPSEFARQVTWLERNVIAVLRSLLEARPNLSITEDIVERTRWTHRQPIIYSFFLNSPDLVHLSKSMFAYIVQHFDPNRDVQPVDIGLVQTILRRGEDVGYGRSETTEASTLDEEFGRDPELVIDGCKSPSIKQDILALMVVNDRCAADLFAIVVEHYKGVQISQNLLTLMVANERHGAKMLAITLKYYKDIHISQDLLASMLADSYNGNFNGAEMFAVVLKHRKGIHISQDLLVAAATNCRSGGGELFDLIHEYDGSIEVSDKVLKAAAGNRLNGKAIFSAILSHYKKTEISGDTLNTAAGNTSCGAEIFSAILSHNMKFELSEDTLKAAARNDGEGGEILVAILSHDRNIVISTEVMAAMTEERHVDLDIMNMLMDHGSCEVNDRFESREKMMKSSVNRACHYDRCKLRVTREMKEAAIRWEPDAINFLNAHKRPNVTFTSSTTQAVSEDPDP